MDRLEQYSFKEMLELVFSQIVDVKITEKEVENNISQKKTFYLLPNVRKARLFLPANVSLQRFWMCLDLYPAISPYLILKKYFVTVLKLFENFLPIHSKVFVISKSSFAKSLYNYFSTNISNIDKVCLCSIRMGGVGKGIKLVIQFQDYNGSVMSYIKVSQIDFLGEFLKNEKYILNQLYNNKLFSAPKVLGFKKTNEFLSLEISPVIKPTYWPRPSLDSITTLLARLSVLTSDTAFVPFKYNEIELNNLLIDKEIVDLVKKSINSINQEYFPRPLCNRDLAYWNVTINRAKQISIIDWEFGIENHLPFIDLFHYIYHSKINTSKKSIIIIYKKLFLRDKNVKNAILNYCKLIGYKNLTNVFNFFVVYLYDWYKLERERASLDSDKGWRHYKLLKYLAHNPSSSFTL